MDCCNYGEYRAHGVGQYGAGAGWDGYGSYAPLPYAPYAHAYYAPHAHDPYARYYRYDYPTHPLHQTDHVMPMDYGAYTTKETRVRRTIARRDARSHTPAHHLPLPHTPPLECGMNGRGPTYCDPQIWPHYQMSGLVNGSGWNGSNAIGPWASRGMCSRDLMRYPSDCRLMKVPQLQSRNQVCPQDGRSTPYPMYEDTSYSMESNARQRNTTEFSGAEMANENVRVTRERIYVEPHRSPPVEKRPPVVPLPAFQQAFGSTEIGKFAEAFSRAEVALEDAPGDNFVFDSFQEWEGSSDPQWSSQPASREIKCEDNY